MIEFTWDIHHSCNYRCPYCWFNEKWGEIKKNNLYPGTDRLIEYWENVYKKYGTVQIQITGGEPFTYPDFANIVAHLSQMHKIGITTNLSGDIESFIEKVQKDNVSLGMSFHPCAIDFDSFFKKALMLKETYFNVNVLFLAWPPYIERLLDYKKRFEERELKLTVLTFWGKYNGKDYPQGYTEEEREIIDSVLGTRGESGEKFQLTPKRTKGKLCRAGQIYALIHPNGNMYRCGGGNWKQQHEPFTNLFDDNFKLLEEPQPCDSEECPCNEWSFLLVGENNDT